MIREFEIEELDEVMSLWLDTNVAAHDFIDKEEWENAYDDVRAALPSSDLFVYEEDSIIKGFIGITGGDYIAGLFVEPRFQSQGIGQKLLDYAKGRYARLELDVFVKNEGALRFYLRNDFVISCTKVNPDFGHKEHHLLWLSQA